MYILKKFISGVLVVAILGGAGYVGYQYWLNRKIPEYISSGKPEVSVTIPLGGLDYVDIEIDGINTTLLKSNESTVWEFNDGRIMRTDTQIDDKVNTGYQAGLEVYKKIGDYYITVISQNRYLLAAYESLQVAEPYKVSVPDVNKDDRVSTLPIDISTIVFDEEYSHSEGNAYMTATKRFGKVNDCIAEAAARVVTLSGKPVEWWYSDDNNYVICAGDEYVAIKTKDYTTQYYVTFNKGGLGL